MEKKCNWCNKPHDPEEVKRKLGEFSRPYLEGFCSAYCYTQATIALKEMKEKKKTSITIEGDVIRIMVVNYYTGKRADKAFIPAEKNVDNTKIDWKLIQAGIEELNEKVK